MAADPKVKGIANEVSGISSRLRPRMGASGSEMDLSLGHIEDTTNRKAALFDRKEKIKELEKFFSAKYVGVAFNMPPACGTFWGLMEEEIYRVADEDSHPFSKDVNEVLQFLSIFFSINLVEQTKANIVTLGESFLGNDYTLRRGKGLIARAVLDDVEVECDVEGSPLHGFFGHVDLDFKGNVDAIYGCPRAADADDDSGGWQSSAGRGIARSGRSGRGLGRGAGSGAGGAGGGGLGGRNSAHFETMDRHSVSIVMSPFSTPSFGDPARIPSIKARSREFVSHSLVENNQAMMYDPHVSEDGQVQVFHGTRTSSLVHFRRRGIDPRYHRNEFSMDAAFYVSNSIRQSYEHPMLYHPSSVLRGTVSVLVFELDVRVLHGLEPPPGATSPFTNLWFRDLEEDKMAWHNFCKDNFTEREPGHDYDLVIGPVCLPNDEEDYPYGKLSVILPGNVPLTQIAFCSRRSRAWLETCFRRVYVESRGTTQF